MAGDKYLGINPSTGRQRLVAANQTSAGAGDAGKIVALDSNGKLPVTMMPSDWDPEGNSLSVTATEDIAAGDVVNYYNSSGAKVRKADTAISSGPKPVMGWAPAAILNTASGTIQLGAGTMTKTGHGFAVGATLYQNPAVPGGLTVTPPSTAGQYLQKVGFVIDANTIQFLPEDYVEL